MSQGKYPSTQSHYPGKINTKGNLLLLSQIVTSLRGGTLCPIKKQTKSKGILKIILSDLIIIVMVIITIMMMMMMTMILMIIVLSHSCPIHPLVTQGVLQKLNLI